MTTPANLIPNVAAFCKANPGHGLFIPSTVIQRLKPVHNDCSLEHALQRLQLRTKFTPGPHIDGPEQHRNTPGLWVWKHQPA